MLRRIRTENAQQTNSALQILIIIIEPELDIVVVVIGHKEAGNKETRAVFCLEV